MLPTDSCVRLIHVGRGAPNGLLHIHRHPIQCTGKLVVYVCMKSDLHGHLAQYDSLMTGKFDGQVLVVDTLRAIVEGGEPWNVTVQ